MTPRRRQPSHGSGGPLRSALYEGVVSHRRTGAAGLGPAHRFSYRIAMLHLDLDEVDAVVALHPLWRSGPGPAVVRIRRDDLPGDRSAPAAAAARTVAAGHLGRCPDGPVAVLAQPRTWGWQFNPVTAAYCHDTDGSVAALVVEVTNTPWHERTTFAVGPPGEHVVGKAMHVSPFLPMALRYRLRYDTPGDHLHLAIDVERTGDGGPGRDPGDVRDGGDSRPTVVLRTALSMQRHELSRGAMSRLLWRYPFMTARVSAGIYTQAARLRLAGAPFHPHPGAIGTREPDPPVRKGARP